jgi:hypothetical protein
VQVTLTEGQTRQFVTLYQALQGFDTQAMQAGQVLPILRPWLIRSLGGSDR